MKADNGYHIRFYREGDEEEINRLYNQVFHAQRTLEEWTWKFKENPLGDTNLIAVAEADGKIVGQYASLPRLVKYGDSIIKVAIVVDNYVVAEFRGGVRGVQWKTFRHSCEYGATRQYAYGMGFPNREHYVIGKRFLKYADFGSVAVLRKRLNWRLPVQRRFPWLPKVIVDAVRSLSSLGYRRSLQIRERKESKQAHIRQVRAFDGQFDVFWDKIKEQHAIVGVRDRQYLEWRYRRPGIHYEIITSEIDGEMTGYLVSTIGEEGQRRTGYVVDVLVDEHAETGSGLVQHALVRFLSKGVDDVQCWLMEGSALQKTFEQYGFVRRDRDQTVKGVYLLFDTKHIDDAFIGNSRNWYVTMGDSDVF